jgi:hypothetical protein
LTRCWCFCGTSPPAALGQARNEQLCQPQVEALVCGDTRRADVLVTAQLHRVIVEANGPWHFVRAPDGSIVHRDGTTALRDHLFQGAGYTLLSVRVEDMTPLDFHTPSFRRWLRSELQDVGLACGTTPAQVWLACRADTLARVAVPCCAVSNERVLSEL